MHPRHSIMQRINITLPLAENVCEAKFIATHVRKDQSGAELLGESLEDVAEDGHTQDVSFP